MSYESILRNHLLAHEGVRSKPYKDSVGILTIGVGRNLEAVGLRPDEIEYLLQNDIKEAETLAKKLVPKWEALDPVRRAIVTEMCFNLGGRFAEFKNTLKAINARRWTEAGNHMMDSKWAEQVGVRALKMAYSMRTGKL